MHMRAAVGYTRLIMCLRNVAIVLYKRPGAYLGYHWYTENGNMAKELPDSIQRRDF